MMPRTEAQCELPRIRYGVVRRILLPRRWVHEVTGGPNRLRCHPAQGRGSLAVTQGIVVAVYGLHLVEASPAIYVILALGVACEDNVVAGTSVHLVVAFAGEDLVVTTATPEAVLAAETP